MTHTDNAEMSVITDEGRTRALRALDRNLRASRIRLRYRALRHPVRLGYPTPSQVRKWKQRGYSVRAKAITPWGATDRRDAARRCVRFIASERVLRI